MNEHAEKQTLLSQPNLSLSERVVLVDESAQPIGSAEKFSVHTHATPLHLAFSCYLTNDLGQVLLTRRALSKLTWPGVWTNSFCGHPGPGEALNAAVERRASQELGTKVRDLRQVIPDFRYRAVDASGIVENEICPVYIASIAGDLAPRSDEVAEWEWVDVPALIEAVRLTPFAFSPWMQLQIPLLQETLQAVPARTDSLHDAAVSL